MTYLRKLDVRPVLDGIEFDIYSLDGVLWVSAEQVSQALKRDHRALVRALVFPLSPWQTRRVPLPVWDYRYHREVDRVRTLYSLHGARVLCAAAGSTERASRFFDWLSDLEGSIHE